MLIQLLGATPAEQGWLATLRDRVEEHRRSQPSTDNGVTSGRFLPPVLTPPSGRDAESQAVVDLLARSGNRLVTLTGPSGVGKSSLALAVATQLVPHFVDGVGFVSLAPVRDPGLVMPAITKALGLRRLAARPSVEILFGYLRTRQVLLVLDNAEHLLPAAPQLGALLAAAPRLGMLVTSRSPLGLQDEQVYPVTPLAARATDELVEPRDGELDTGGRQRVKFSQAQGSASITRTPKQPSDTLVEPADVGSDRVAAARLWNIPARSPVFTGREELLAALHTVLAEGSTAVVQALHGMGGVGKTALAIEYAHRYGAKYEVAWWIPAEEPALVADRLGELAHALGLASVTDPVAVAVARLLGALRKRNRWLLIFDNAEDPATLARYLPGATGQVVITSRNPGWQELATPLEVTVFNRGESIALLRRRTPRLTDSEAGRIADALGDLPLALAQAGDYLAATTTDVQDYLTLLAERTTELLPRPTPAVPATEPPVPTPPSLTTVPSAVALSTEPSAGGVPRVVSALVQGLTEVIGRDTELAALRAAFTDSARRDRPIWRVLTGLGGVGKTSLARAYAQRYQEHYGLVWWIRAEDREAVAAEFRALLDILSPHYAAQTHDPVQAVHAILANRPDPWLLVLDNIAEPEGLRGLLPAAGAGDVLVTSRAGTWPDRHVVLPVRPLAPSHAVELITSLSGDADQTSATVLAGELGGLPLALAQAGCYVARSALDLAGYLTLYRSRRAELHQQGHAPDYPETLATTWQLAFDQLSPSARALLNLLAWYAPDAIPLDRLLTAETDHLQLPAPVTAALARPLLNDALHQQQAITELLAYGLLTRGGPAGSVTVHRLVQAVTADQLTATNEHRAWIDAAAVLLDANYPKWKGVPQTWTGISARTTTVWQSLRIHLRTLIEHLAPDQPITLYMRLVYATSMGEGGDIVQARELAAELIEDSKRILGPDHLTTLLARAGFAYFTGQAGEIRRAQELTTAVVEDLTRVLGADHGYTLFIQGSLIRWTALSGEVERARDLNAAIVEEVQQALGADDLLTLGHRARLVRWIGEAGDAARARELAAAVVNDDKRVLGPEHRETLAARSYLVRWTGEAGDPGRARELATKLVEDDERILGPDHRHTLFARVQLARWTGESGNAEAARKLTTAVLKDLVRVYGAHHRYTLLARGWLVPWSRENL
jgi:predicted ATPase